MMAFTASLSVRSQEPQKILVAIPGFQSSARDIPATTVNGIHQRVIDAFVDNSKFSVVERSQLDELKNEVDLQKSESFMDGKGNVSDKVKNTGASYVVTGVISRYENTKEKREKTQYDQVQKKNVVVGYYDVYFCNIELNVKMIDVATSQIMYSDVISVGKGEEAAGGGKGLMGTLGSLLGTSETQGASSVDEAYAQALDGISGKVSKILRAAFPNVLTIAEIVTRDRKGNAEDLLLVGDFTDGMGKKQDLFVKIVTEVMVGGKKLVRKKVIGELKVIKLEDGGFLTARIKSGEEEITKAFEEKKNIQITETE